MLKIVNWNYKINNKYIIKNLNLEIKKGEYISILGANGSGKSTFANLLNNLITLSEGSIFLDGEEISQQLLGHMFGLVFQNPENQFVKQIVEEDIVFALENKNVKREVMSQKLSEVVEMLDIRHLLKKEVYSLSGGQKQKVAIASQLIVEKQYFVFDESTSSLDPQSKVVVRNLINKLHQNGKTIIHITHDMEEALLADRVLIFHHGSIAKDMTSKNFHLSKQDYEHYRINPSFIANLSLELHNLNSKYNIVSNEEELIKIWK